MLEEIRIRGLGVIDEAVLELDSGFTVITGETGAGKTMVVTSLGLLFGGKANAGAVRSGAKQALVEGRLLPPPGSRVAERAEEAGAELDEGALVFGRSVSSEGRSRAFLGGRSVPAAILAELAEELIAVHGQSDQQRLLRPARQRGALDRFAGESVEAPLERYSDAYNRLREVERTLDEITTKARERAREADVLRAGVERIEEVAPQPGEDVALAAEENRLANADDLRGATSLAHEALVSEVSDTDAAALLARARQSLGPVIDHDPALAALSGRLQELSYLVVDVASDLASYASSVETDPARLAAVQERRAALTSLTRRYGDTLDEVLTWAEESSRRLAELDDDDQRLEQLAAERAELRSTLTTTAGEVSAARFAAATKFATAVSAELASLALPHARLVVSIEQVDAADGLPMGDRHVAYGPSGVDEVELLLAPHPGAQPTPLGQGASGGELSRVMLAVEVVFADADPVPTFVFDEVDAGVGGKAAVEVGRRLARLARTAQVVVVTHLPQVAAFADSHLRVVKSSSGSVTSSGIERLDQPQRIVELARMLAGQEDSASARAHAEELLQTAASGQELASA